MTGELSDRAVGVYRSMLRWPTWNTERIGEHLGLGDPEVLAAMDELAAHALLRGSAGALRPVRPDQGVTLLLDRQRELDATRRAIADLAAEFAGATTHDGVEHLTGSAVADRVTRLVGRADHEVAACLPASDPLVTDRALLGPAPIRLLVETPADIDPALSACGQVKSADRLPASLVVCDRSSAVVPLDTSAALLVRAPHLVALLCTLFELCWSAAAELGAPSTGLNDQERAVLTFLSRGRRTSWLPTGWACRHARSVGSWRG